MNANQGWAIIRAGDSRMTVSLILTVCNEAEYIPRLFDSIVAQTRQPDEVIVCDGGSRDETVARLEKYSDQLNLRIESAPGANISTGRNIAIRAAVGEIIAVTDAGVRLEPDWLARLVAPFADSKNDRTALAAGFFQAEAGSLFELAMGATVLPVWTDVHPDRFLPSSRSVAFRKSTWEAVGGYPEWLPFSEDVVFDLRVRERFGAFKLVPDAIVHFRPRSSLRRFSRQYFNYASGDGHAGLFPRIHFIRYFTYLVVVPLAVFAALTISPWLWALGLLAGFAYIRTPIRRLVHVWSPLSVMERLSALALIPIIRVVGDFAKMCGYPMGVWQRIRPNRD